MFITLKVQKHNVPNHNEGEVLVSHLKQMQEYVLIKIGRSHTSDASTCSYLLAFRSCLTGAVLVKLYLSDVVEVSVGGRLLCQELLVSVQHDMQVVLLL